ncbi:serine hydrolase family protein [Antrihabitans cavernicola]|uniref:Serine hydrolase family protein n=2 Tax=Antrihabitans cavernicola TaxID=2495913 RepID=A0A5A7SCB3_9NOCA|nr:serine hydrolase family protein [Spelaeibacter cavernicola]
MHFVIVPGIDGSDEEHWQSRWQAEWGMDASRIAPSSWAEPNLDDWVGAIDRAVTDSHCDQIVLVAHSLGSLAAAQWVTRRRPDRSGACGVFLVAPPDNSAPNFPKTAHGFSSLRRVPLHVPGVVVCSDNDPYCATSTGRLIANAFQLDHISAGNVGHINSSSGLGRWDFGRALLTAFSSGLVASQTAS